MRNLLHCVGVPLLLLLLAPFLVLYTPVFVVQLRCRECQDPEIAPRPEAHHMMRLAELEDHDVTNQFSALGNLKPGVFRRWTLTFFLWILELYDPTHFQSRPFNPCQDDPLCPLGFPGQQTAHALCKQLRWESGKLHGRLYQQGRLGLNLVFQQRCGLSSDHWLILHGAKNEQKFKYYIRRHEFPTEVWYNAHPGLTALDLERNTRIRAGIEEPFMTDGEIENGCNYSKGDATMDTSVIDYRDVQGLVRFGYAHLPRGLFPCAPIESAAVPAAWLATVSITTAERLAERPPTALHVALTCAGLQALGVPAEIMEGFAPEFITG